MLRIANAAEIVVLGKKSDMKQAGIDHLEITIVNVGVLGHINAADWVLCIKPVGKVTIARCNISSREMVY